MAGGLENVYFRCKICKKLLKKSGLRQHVKHHRSKGDTWEGDIEETGQPEVDFGDVEIKEETLDFEEDENQVGAESKESETEDKACHWDSDSTIENSDAEYWKSTIINAESSSAYANVKETTDKKENVSSSKKPRNFEISIKEEEDN